MTLADKAAADSLLRLLQLMRETGRFRGRIEVVVDEGRATALHIVKISECEVVEVH